MTKHRLHDDGPLAAGQLRELADARAHYLLNVLRLRQGMAIALFNARDGEWQGTIEGTTRRQASIRLQERTRPPAAEEGPGLVMAPIRPSRFDWVVEKATELGVGRIVPVLVKRSVVKLERIDRLQAIATEASEQCGRLTVPEVEATRPLADWLRTRDAARALFFADEQGSGTSLLRLPADTDQPPPDLLIGPEGGFEATERDLLLAQPNLVRVDLGTRILRAETAALASLAIWQEAARLRC